MAVAVVSKQSAVNETFLSWACKTAYRVFLAKKTAKPAF